MNQGIAMPETGITPLDNVARGVTGLRIALVNVYAVSAPDHSWVLIDAGLYFSAGRIRLWTEQQFGAGARPSAILLTHGHFDHTGSLKELAAEWNVPVYAHPLEMPYLTGQSKYPPPDPTVGGGAMAYMASLYPRGPVQIGARVRPLPQGGVVPGLPGWRWIHTPGHTAGHVSFFRETDRVLIAGDAVVTTKQESLIAVATQRPELHGPPAYYTSDWDAAKLSVGRLAGLLPAVIASGHGVPMAGLQVASALDNLAQNFDQIARPARGRYVRKPAVTNEHGVVSLPPAVPYRAPYLLAGALLAGAVTYTMLRRRR